LTCRDGGGGSEPKGGRLGESEQVGTGSGSGACEQARHGLFICVFGSRQAGGQTPEPGVARVVHRVGDEERVVGGRDRGQSPWIF
jgi:hypothetical protein